MTNLLKGKQVDSNTITNTNIADNTIENAKIAASTLEGAKIAANTITGTNLNDSARQSTLDSKIICTRLSLTGEAAGTGTSIDVTDSAFQAIKNSPGGIAAMGYDGDFSTLEGLITDPTNGFNKSNISNDATDGEIVDGSNNTVFGRITDTLSAKSGTNVTTTNGSTTVTFSSPHNYVVGEYFAHSLDTQKRVGKVASVTVAALELEDAWQGDSLAAQPGAQAVTVQLDFLVKSGGSESAYTAQSQTITAIVPVSLTLLDAPAESFVHSVANTDGFPAGHIHDDRYFTETELGASDSSGANLAGSDRIGSDSTGLTNVSGSTVQAQIESIDTAITAASAGVIEETDDLTLGVGQTVAPGGSFPTSLSQTRIAGTAIKLIINQLMYTDPIVTETGGTVTITVAFPFTVDENDTVTAVYLRSA